jgi:hypothetical protein
MRYLKLESKPIVELKLSKIGWDVFFVFIKKIINLNYIYLFIFIKSLYLYLHCKFLNAYMC